MIPIKLMFVEDDPLLRERLQRMLKREVSEVRSYALPSEALNDLQQFAPDVVLTDIKMPGMTGLEMVKIIRMTFPNIPVIVASAFSEPDLFMSAIRLKVENYVVKPIDVSQLIESIRSVADNLSTKKLLHEKEALLEQYKHIVDLSAYITITDKSGIITYVNDRFCELSGYRRDELIGRAHNIVRHPDMPRSFYKDMWSEILQGRVWQGIIKNRRKDGSTFYIDTTIAPMVDPSGNINEFISIKIDISDLILSRQKLQSDIITDRLTNLPNRIKLHDDIHSLEHFTMLLIDIDRFKEVNMLFGIRLGDLLLKFFAKKILEVFGNEAMDVYHLASDEFVVLAKDDAREAMQTLAYQLKRAIEASPMEFEKVSFDIEFTNAMIYADSENINPLEQLQGTMSEAKRTKRFLVEHDARASLQKEYEDNFEWTKKIKKGLSDDRITVFFQPIYDIKNDQVVKFESLVRFIDEDGTVVPPFKFLNVAKRSRYYRDITHTVITKACTHLAQTGYNFSINLSIEDLTDEETLDFLIQTVENYNLQNRVIVEVLESEGIDNFYLIKNVFERLTDAGLRIAIDDFGSGYSNFAYLVNLPVSLLKIDGSLIKNIVSDRSARIIVQSIVMFAHELGMKVVAEFVSEKEILDMLKFLSIDFAQGFYIGKPESEPVSTFHDSGRS